MSNLSRLTASATLVAAGIDALLDKVADLTPEEGAANILSGNMRVARRAYHSNLQAQRATDALLANIYQ